MGKHEHGKYDEVQARQGFRQSLVVARQAAEAVDPAETTFKPSSRIRTRPMKLCRNRKKNLRIYV
jgi:hypothetical protein